MRREGSEDTRQLSPTPASSSFSCLLIGTESLLIQCAKLLLQGHHRVCGIVSAEPLIRQWAKENGIPQIEPGSNLVERLSQQRFDYLFSITNLSILPKEVVSLPCKGAINFHDGPLPRYAGIQATSWALLNQEKIHGITWHWISDGVDQGDILTQRTVPITEGETAFTLNAKCYEAAIDSFAELIDELASDRIESRRQDLSQHTYFGKYQRPPAACVLSWHQPAEALSALVRALDFGPYANPLGLPKLLWGGDVYIVPTLEVRESRSHASPGTITALERDMLSVATANKEVVLRELRTLENHPLSIADFVAKGSVQVGDRLTQADPEMANHLTTLNSAVCKHEAFWCKRLAALETIEIPYADHSTTRPAPTQYATLSMSLPEAVHALLATRKESSNQCDVLIAAFAAYLARLSGTYTFDLGFSEAALQKELAGFQGFFATQVPLRVALDLSASCAMALESVSTQLALARKHKSYARDLTLRYPELSALRERNGQALLPIIVEQVESVDDYSPVSGSTLTLLLSAQRTACWWVYDTAVFTSESIARMQRQFSTCLENIAADRNGCLEQIPLLTEAERHTLTVEWNHTQVAYPQHLCLHQLFERQVERTPGATAAVWVDQRLTYHQLNSRANQLARHLRKLNVGPETRVGVYLHRSLDMLVGLLGILKAGGAYVPLDPTYPAERLAFMVEDAHVPVLVTQAGLFSDLPAHHAHVVCVDTDWDTISVEREDNVQSDVAPDNLGYVIYTSGSTGKPKGVMVSHRNVVNFFTGMDACIPHDPPGVWLAVTSLSFDISVLELFWTLARGFKLVLYADQYAEKTPDQVAIEPTLPHPSREIAFSLCYFASDEKEQGVTDKYKLLLEGVRFADTHGFAAVWTPERHFHAFGGLYPNPAVTGAAIAAVTERVGIRAGSCVLPLHNPIRVAEEWSLVDNISQGRVGISFAAGWQPNDFVLKPENFANSKEIMFRDIEVVRKLWRGEAVNFPGPHGDDVAVSTLPRPVQAELPVWVTTAGDPETFRMAGARGFNLLTHLLGQRVEELAEKLVLYRKAWVDNGHPGKGHVTLMLHTFVGDDIDKVRETVRNPMIDYLRSSVGLIKQAAWQFPTFKQRAEATGKNPLEIFETEDVSEEDMEALLTFAFERYFETSGLFGPPSTCLQLVHTLKAIEVDEIACLIDFGVRSETVLEHLQHLKTLKELAAPAKVAEDYSIPALVKRHHVTHMQCTPSLASMLTIDEEGRVALGALQTLMVGGEAFPVALARELTQLVSGTIINMYGPTETTIWSSTYTLNGDSDPMPIGWPIANTEMYILDHNLQPVPVGAAGELFIGGAGVVRGYLDRPELTHERFIPHPFKPDSGARVYRTGDLARYRPDGNIEFLGRIDHQVKIRGYRIELGEIETVLVQHPNVQQAVVVARSTEQAGEKRLVAYVIAHQHATLSSSELRSVLQEKLPDFMVPSAFVFLDALPLTPNGKVDRQSLPAPDQTRPSLEKGFVAPQTLVEEALAKIWAEILGLERVGVHDNFFELGGHSLLAVRLVSQVRETFRIDLPLHSLFTVLTVTGLSQTLIARETKPGQTEKIARILKQLEEMPAEEVGKILQKRKSERSAA